MARPPCRHLAQRSQSPLSQPPLFSALIKERLYAGEAIVATGFGIIFGPHCADLVDPRSWGSPSFDDVTLEFTRIVLALSVFAVGVELPR